MNDPRNIESIAYNDYVNLENCEHEPIQYLGKVQSHGYLIAFDRHDKRIEFVSENCDKLFGIAVKELLNIQITDLFDADYFQKITDLTSSQRKNDSLSFTTKDTSYNLIAYTNDRHIVLEFEEFPDGHRDAKDLYVETQNFLDKIQRTKGLQDFCQVVAEQIKVLTGFNRVMIYRFDEQYNGEVIAESVDDQFESFLGLRYPHTDIPAQARRLYTINLIRAIPDINSEPVSILTNLRDTTHKSLDLTHSTIRSVSPIHIEYLKNMGVGASMSISIVVDRKLWGLVACHHYSEKLVPHYTKLTARQYANFLASLVGPKLLAEESIAVQHLNDVVDHFTRILNHSENILDDVLDMEELYRFIEAHTLVIFSNSQIYILGEKIPYKSVQILYDWIDSHIHSDHFYTNNLRNYIESEHIDPNLMAGIAYFSFGEATKQSMMWVRKSVDQEIHWGGDPSKAINKNSSKHGLSPRQSFSLWKEIVKGKSKEWLHYQIDAAGRVAHIIHNYLLLSHLREEEEKSRVQNLFLREKNMELETFNQICSHDLQEPARKIRTFASILKQKGNVEDEYSYNLLQKVQRSAEKLEELVLSLLHLSRVTRSDMPNETVNLNRVLEEVLHDLELSIEEKGARIVNDPLPIISGVNIQLQQLFLNLIGNSIKYSEEQPEIRITVETIPSSQVADFTRKRKNKNYYRISFSDNGIGFEPQYTDRIFDIFQRLHNAEKYSGTGVGLSICKKIVDNHDGTIRVESTPGEGSVFHVYLPTN